jgi:hypothetical protein
MDPLVQTALDAIANQDREQLRQLFHPYIHWTEQDTKIRGRTKVLTHLAGQPDIDPPVSYEIRDNQIYRWTAGEPTAPPST